MHSQFGMARTFLTLAGLYYPIFFLQLNAIKNGMDPHLAFYTVSLSFLPISEHHSHVQRLLDCDFEWSERPRTCYTEFTSL